MTSVQAPVNTPTAPPLGGSPDDSSLLARYEAGGFERFEPPAPLALASTGRDGGPGRGRLTTRALVAWVAGGVVLVVAAVVALVVFFGSGDTLPPSTGDAASLLPTRIDGFTVEVEKQPGFVDAMANAENGAALVITENGGSGRAFVASVVLDGAASQSEATFGPDLEQGLHNSEDQLGEFTDVTLDAVAMRGADLSGGDYRRLWWWRPYQDAVLVVFASDDRTGRKVLEALVEQNALPS